MKIFWGAIPNIKIFVDRNKRVYNLLLRARESNSMEARDINLLFFLKELFIFTKETSYIDKVDLKEELFYFRYDFQEVPDEGPYIISEDVADILYQPYMEETLDSNLEKYEVLVNKLIDKRYSKLTKKEREILTKFYHAGKALLPKDEQKVAEKLVDEGFLSIFEVNGELWLDASQTPPEFLEDKILYEQGFKAKNKSKGPIGKLREFDK